MSPVSFMCPHCSELLQKTEREYFCVNNHHFDVAKEGYVNLLPPNEKASKDPGDSAEMITARTQFLEKGFYHPLADAVATLAIKHFPKNGVIADIGCGQGYYTQYLYRKMLSSGLHPSCVGIDISKHALRAAAKQEKDIQYAVASVIKLPLLPQSIDIITNIFAPRHFPEFSRVLKPGGAILIVSPGPNHLQGLKSALFLSEAPHEEATFIPEKGIEMIEEKSVESSMTLESSDDILHLCMMTPFWWKMTREGRENAAKISNLTITIDCVLRFFRKDISQNS
jgi:23S rRNA (guanine745-N1)-methyltransferase